MLKLDAIGIVTSDLPACLRFYRLLGVDAPDIDDDHVEATLPNGLRLMFDKVELVKQFTDWVEPVGQRMGLAFLCESPQHVDETCAAITAAGFKVAKQPWDAFWGQRYAQAEDPDGNLVDLFAPL